LPPALQPTRFPKKASHKGSAGEIHTYWASPRRGVATGDITSQGAIGPKILSDDARKLLQQQLRFGRSGAAFLGLR
jgi:hypothetical protein